MKMEIGRKKKKTKLLNLLILILVPYSLISFKLDKVPIFRLYSQ